MPGLTARLCRDNTPSSVCPLIIKSVQLLDIQSKGRSMAYKKRQGICLQDCGSTHGTYVGDNRLQPHVDHVLSNDENITFGVKVTSGTRKSNPILH